MSRALRLNEQVQQLGTEAALEVLARVRHLEAQGRSILHLEIGEPDFLTPPHIVEAGIRALRDGASKYAPAAGLPELRAVIAQWSRGRGLSVAPENVLVTSGAKPMLFYALTALVNPGDEVLIPDPGFPIFESAVRYAFGHPVTYHVNPAWQQPVDPSEIARRISSKTRVLVLNSPHNPTGAVLDSVTLAALAKLAERRRLTIISDEIYSRLVFDGEHRSIASFPGMSERTVVIDGFSKAYAMTGWRLGYGIMPTSVASHIERYIINTTSCAPPFVQHAGIAALTGPQTCVDDMRDEYRARLGFMVLGLNKVQGVSCAVPKGAFFVFPTISGLLQRTKASADEFADSLLDKFNLACLPGSAFGSGGADHLRFSLAASWSTLERALEVLNVAVEVRPGSSRASDSYRMRAL